MKYPEDRDKARRKLGIIARRLPVFSIVDCFTGEFRRYHGRHNSSDWQECADGLVSEGKLYTDGAGRYSAKPF